MTRRAPEQGWTDKEIDVAIKAVERDHLCGCETCVRSGAICPASASTLILELAGLRLALHGVKDPAEWRRRVERLLKIANGLAVAADMSRAYERSDEVAVALDAWTYAYNEHLALEAPREEQGK